MKHNVIRTLAYGVAISAVVIPVILMFVDVRLGVPLLLLGVFICFRAIRSIGQDKVETLSDNELQKLGQHSLNRSRMIYVQIVDDYGRDLPEHVAAQRLAEAQAKAGPRDTVLGVRRKVTGA